MFLSPQAQYNAWDGHDGCTLWDYGDHGGLPCGQEYLEMFKKHYDLRAGLKTYLYSAFETQSRTGLRRARLDAAPPTSACGRSSAQQARRSSRHGRIARAAAHQGSVRRRVYSASGS